MTDTPATTVPFPAPPPVTDLARPDYHKVGMIAFFISEVAFFSTLIMVYVIFLGGPANGPTPAETLSLGLVLGTTACLLASSVTVHLAEKALAAGKGFGFLWFLTIVLGVLFLAGTIHEWCGLIHDHGLTISRNMFGTTFYTLVGFHAAHVTVGVIMLSIILGLYNRGQIKGPHHTGVQLVSWYWHFVDVVWVVVFLIVYVIGRG